MGAEPGGSMATPTPERALDGPSGAGVVVPQVMLQVVDVPPATDPLPEGSSEEADLAQRGLLDDGS